MLDKTPFLYQEKPKSFVSRLPFLSTDEYGGWLLHMAHIEGLECVDEAIFKEIVPTEQGRFSKTSPENIMVAYNKAFAFNFLGHAWLELLRGRKFTADDKEVEVLTKFIVELSVKGAPMATPFNVIDELYAEMQSCGNYMTVCEAICEAFLEQKFTLNDFERFLAAFEEKENEHLPTQVEILDFYTSGTKQ